MKAIDTKEEIMGYDNIIGIPISNYLLRYIVPFSYSKKSEVEYQFNKECSSYDYAYENLKKNTKWNQMTEYSEKTECYDYLRDIYAINSMGKDIANTIGSIWEYSMKEEDKIHIDTFREKDGQEDISRSKREKEPLLSGKIKQIGLYLMKNNIGLIWYEVELDKKEVCVNQLIEFQNIFKELCGKSGTDVELRYEGSVNVRCENLLTQGNGNHLVKRIGNEEENYKIKTNDLPEAFVEWLKKNHFGNSAIKQIFFTERAKWTKEIEGKKEEWCKLEYKIPVEDNKLGLLINEILFCLDCNIEFYPYCKHENTIKIPDKAILFNFVSMDEMKLDTNIEEKIKYTAYYLTKGFKKSYKPPIGIENEMKYPFENILWFAQREGCGIYATYTKDNKGFIKDNLKVKVGTDYFHLYMTLLQQTYVLLRFNEEIAHSISGNKNEYIHMKNKISDNLEDLQCRINLFLMKNKFASVGFTNHHNQYYEYIEKVLKIKEDIVALNEGVIVLEEILRRREKEEEEQRNERMQRAFSLLTILEVLALPKTLCEFFKINISSATGVLEESTQTIQMSRGEIIVYIITVIVLLLVLISSASVMAKWADDIWQIIKTWLKRIMECFKKGE